MVLFAGAMLLPVLVAVGYGETDVAVAFFASALFAVFIGGGAVMATRGSERPPSRRDGFVLAALVWGVLPLFGAMPLFFSGAMPTVSAAYFEALSGLTTTGATLLAEIEKAPRAILFWRALLQWLGGLGTLVLAIAFLALTNVGGSGIYRSAIPGGERQSLIAAVRHAIDAIWWIYALLTAICAVLLWATGLPPFDAVCHAFSALSTGGFSTRGASVAAFESRPAELVLMIFMVLGAMNFTLHWAAVHGRFRVYREDPEPRYLLSMILAATLLLTFGLAAIGGRAWSDSSWQGLFTAVSVVTTTGFTGHGLFGLDAPVPISVSMLVLVLVLVGGCAGSTAGGLKILRLAVLLKQGNRELARLSFPRGVLTVRYGDARLRSETMQGAWAFFAVFMLCFGVVALGVAAGGVDFRTAVAMAAAAVSNAGPTLQLIAANSAPDFDALSGGPRLFVMAGMLLGRVELFAVLSLLSPAFWRR